MPITRKPGGSSDNAVLLNGDQTIAGVKTYTSIPVLPGTNPSSDNEAARKAYVDQVALGLTVKDSVRAATTTTLPACTYANGTSGVGATLTGNSNGALAAIDGVTLTTNDDVLVKDQSSGAQNGIYRLTTVGDGSNPFVLTRRTDFDSAPSEVEAGAFTTVLEGTTNSNRQYALSTSGTITMGTTALAFTRLSAQQVYTAGDGLDVNANDFSLDIKANDGLAIKSTELGVDYDDSSIGIVTNKLAVKAGGVTNAMLAGSIADSKLSTITTVDKVGWSAVNKTGSTLASIADINTSGLSDGYLLRWDSTTSKWVPVAPGAVGATSQFVYGEQVVHAAGGTALAFTNAAVALTTITANTRKKVNLDGALQFRIIATQTVAGFAGTKLRAQYSTNNSTFNQMDADTSGDLDIGTGTGQKVGAWTNLVSGAKQDVWIQLYTIGGDATADPAFTEIYIQYKFNASIIDGSSSSALYPEYAFAASPNTALTWTSMPAAVTELFGNTFSRQKINASAFTQYRLVVNQSVAGFAGADINLQYSLDGTNFLAADSGAAGELDIGTGTGVKYGAFASLVSGARGDVWFRIVGKDGNGTISPAVRQVKVQFSGQVFSPTAGSDTQVIFNDGGVAAGDSGMVYDKTGNKLTIENVKITGGTPGVGKVLTSDADGDASWGNVPSTVSSLDDLDDVDLTTPPTNGQFLGFVDITSFTATYSALRWNGNDYKEPNLGAGHSPTMLYLFSSTPREIYADGQTFNNESSTENLHVSLITWGDASRSTMLIPNNFLTSQGQSENASGLQTLLQAQVDPSCTVDNFKTNYMSYNSGASYTFNGLTGFEQAGTVTVVSGGTSPAITFVPGAQQFEAVDGPAAQQHFGSGIYPSTVSGGGDTAQSVSTASRTLLNIDTNKLFANSEWNVDGGSHTFSHQSGNDVVGYAILTVIDDSEAAIPTAQLEVEWKPGMSFKVLAAGGGSLAFPIVISGDNTVEFRAYLTHTEIGSVNVFARVDIYWPR